MYRKAWLLPFVFIVCLLLPVAGQPTATNAQNQPTALPGCWRVAPTPRIDALSSTINALSATGPNDIWAVGVRLDTRNSAIAMHYDGNAWTIVATPVITQPHYLTAVYALTPADVWAVGSYNNGASNPLQNKDSGIVFHWNGKAWSNVAIPLSFALHGVWAAAAGDVWAVGDNGHGQAGGAPQILHWNGKTWSSISPQASYLNDIVGTAANNVWAIGQDVLHWDGKSWSKVPRISLDELRGAAVVDANNIWAVGYASTRFPIEHWDGTGWARAAGVPPSALIDLHGVAALAPNDVWAVGNMLSGNVPLIMRWDGAMWKGIPNPVPGFGGDLEKIIKVDGELWAGGSRKLRGATWGDAVIMRYTSTPCAGPPSTTPLNPPAPVPGIGSLDFVTGRSTSGIFLKYWQEHGGLQQQGYPISNVIGEMSELNNTLYTVQYFERAAFEYHPEYKGTPYEVLLAQLGTFQYKQKYPNGAPNQRPNRDPGTLFFPQTGKRLGGAFLDYWQTHGGVQQQGYPISEEFTEVSDLDGKPYTVQYFERAVFEWHSENKPPYSVLLSQLGKFRYDKKYVSAGALPAGNVPRLVAGKIHDDIQGGGHNIVWPDYQSDSSSANILSYDATQNVTSVVAPNLPRFALGNIATDGRNIVWRVGGNTDPFEVYNFSTGSRFTIPAPSIPVTGTGSATIAAIAVDNDNFYYTYTHPDTQRMQIVRHLMVRGDETRIYDAKLEISDHIIDKMVAKDGILLWSVVPPGGRAGERSLHAWSAALGREISLASGPGNFGGFGVSGNYIVWSYFNSISDQVMYLYDLQTQTRKVLATGAADNPVMGDGKVAWVRWPSAESGESDGWEIEVYDIQRGTISTQVANLSARPEDLVLLDTGKLAFTADTDPTSPDKELFIVDLD
ncbi:MAG: hypothetical protein ABI670_04885 [Chloroflexota bacterium]